MVMSILERTREIGVMKAIGGSDGDIRRIFLVEAAAIGLMGGIGKHCVTTSGTIHECRLRRFSSGCFFDRPCCPTNPRH